MNKMRLFNKRARIFETKLNRSARQSDYQELGRIFKNIAKFAKANRIAVQTKVEGKNILVKIAKPKLVVVNSYKELISQFPATTIIKLTREKSAVVKKENRFTKNQIREGNNE